MTQAFILPTQILGAERVLRRAADPGYPAISETETGGILVQAGPGTLDIAVDSPAYQGNYALDPAALSRGPVNLAPPTVAGTAAIGQVLTAKPGLWGHDGTLAAPVMAWQWLCDGTAIAGATGMEYTTTSADSGKAISLAETAQDAHGTVQAVSEPLAIPTLLAPTQRAKANGSTAARVFAGLDLGAPAATRDIVVLAAVFGSAGTTITGVTVAGIPATLLAQTLSGGSGLACAGAWLARVPAGATGSVELLTSANTTVQHVALFRGESLTLADSATVAIEPA